MISVRAQRVLAVLVTAGAVVVVSSTVPAFAGQPAPPVPDASGAVAGLPDPGPKANSPQTDLAHHPKGSLQNAAPGAGKVARDSDSTDVTVVTPNADGKTVTVKDYLPAFGVSPAQLASKLRANGENVQVKTTPAASMTVSPQVVNPNECTYGTATSEDTSLCPPPFFWTNEGFTNPHVRFNDHTGAAWPVDTAVYDWNTANGINSYYLYNRCPFQAGARCVDVFEGSYGNTGWVGLTTYQYDIATHAFVDNRMTTQLNEYYNLTDNPPRKTVEHEVGHAVGLGHANTFGSVMNSVPAYSTINTGSPDDFTFLTNLYSIGR